MDKEEEGTVSMRTQSVKMRRLRQLGRMTQKEEDQ
jgi:hypothetical protein